MTAAAQTFSWLWILGGIVGVGAGLLLLVWAMFSDRSRGRERCPQCWYSMAGITGTRCPECGRDARERKRLLKTRRRWRWAAAAVIFMFAGVGTYLTPAIMGGGAMSLLPTTVIIYCLPVLDREVLPPPPPPSYQTYGAPMGRGLIRSVPPDPSEHWAVRELWKRIDEGKLWDWQWKLALERSGMIATRSQWPAHEPLAVRLVKPRWVDGDIHISRQDASANTRNDEAWGFRSLGTLERGARSAEFTVRITQDPGAAPFGSAPSTIWLGKIRLPVRAVDDFDRLCTPTDDAGITLAIRRSVHLVYTAGAGTAFSPFLGTSDHATPWLIIRPDDEARAVIGETAICFHVELLHDGTVMGQMRAVGRPGGGWGAAGQVFSWSLSDTTFIPGWDQTPVTGKGAERWTVRIRGVRHVDEASASHQRQVTKQSARTHILTVWDAKHYWMGSCEIPLTALLDEETGKYPLDMRPHPKEPLPPGAN